MSGGRVVSVTGPVDPESLGHAVTAVHLVADPSGGADGGEPVTMELLGALALGAPNRDNLRLTEDVTGPDLADFGARGGGAVVEVTGADGGRDPRALVRLARASGVTVVMGCGWAAADAVAGRTAESIADELTGDVLKGVDGVRAGVIGEIGPLDPEDGTGRALAAGVAAAARRTGAPVLVRAAATPAATHAVLDLLADGGAGLGRVAVGGCDAFARDVDALAALADRGVYVQFDGLGRLPSVYSAVDDQDVAAAVVALAGRGHAERLLLSPAVSRKSDLKAFGSGGYGFVAEQFAPFLGFQGADEALLTTLTAANPRRWLTMEDR